MTKHTAMEWTEQCDTETELSAKTHYLELAGEALLVGMTRTSHHAAPQPASPRRGLLAARHAIGTRAMTTR
jgi:hypothetical protein